MRLLPGECAALTHLRRLPLTPPRCAQHNGDVFAYPFLTIAPLAVRIAIYAGATFGALGAFRGLNALKREEVRVFEQSGRAGHRASGKTK